jgi:hypothetical protein
MSGQKARKAAVRPAAASHNRSLGFSRILFMPSMKNLNTSLALEHAYFAKDIAELTASQINLPTFLVMLIIHFIASLINRTRSQIALYMNLMKRVTAFQIQENNDAILSWIHFNPSTSFPPIHINPSAVFRAAYDAQAVILLITLEMQDSNEAQNPI